MFKLTEDPQYAHTSNESGHWTLSWQAEKNYAAPLEVELRGYNLKTLVAMQWIDITCDRGERLWRVQEGPSFNDISAHNRDLVIARFRLSEPVSVGETISFMISAKPMSLAGATFPIYLVVNGDEQAGSVTLLTHAGPVRRLAIIARPAPESDSRFRVLVQPQDAGGYATAFAQPVPITVSNGSDALWQGDVQEPVPLALELPSGKTVRLTAHLDAADLASGDAIENGESNNDRFEVTSNPIWTTSADLMPILGEIHWHSDISFDGMRKLEQAFGVARDVVNLDFAAPADHTPKGHWAAIVSACDAANEPGHFATLYSWEQSSDEGHVNFYFTDPDHPMNPEAFDYPIRPAQYIEALPYNNFLAIPHHANAVSYAIRDDGSHYWNAYPWGEPRDDYLRLVEIFQSRGNFEREDPPDGWRTEFRNNGSSAQTALEKGHKIGFTGGTDNHQCWPARENSGRAPIGWIYTGAWVTSRDRQAVFDALYARHTWACWDTRAIVCFRINDAMQGDELKVASGARLMAHIQLAVEQPLAVLEIVSRHDATWPIAANGLEIDTTLDLGPATDNTFFYLRARQNDGAIIYASPIFITLD